LLLPSTAPHQGAAIAERLRARIEQALFTTPSGTSIGVTVSIGLACLDRTPDLNDTPPGTWLFQQADAALYRAKQGGRNRVVLQRGTPAAAAR